MDVFEAVADPTRRDLLERLREGPATLSELAAPFAMTRQAVTKHLDALVAAGLVRVRREGRHRVHELRADPLREVEGWLAPYAAAWDRRLERLGQHLGEDT
ncbi:MAG: metalloregulator ArsR/SmtB family transcription factor [Gemmatimonadota bacterium]|nr:metalloregulator ArsR/SmtB family transcription factor [Gemmatimonadota bacterium]